ncbi:M48 family metalloprotease [Geminicoccus harenae]|uniref:M48 family metalloprotease n=1 Tax=Geminicoccus harenae TaxID=2498453 RepID=UPI00168A8239|nr:M48 family metalloprotease [Geminicoccus harenae]
MKRILLSLLISAALVGCTQVRNPATGELQYTTLSQEDELRLGLQEHPKVLAEFGDAYEGQRTAAYVQEVGQRLVAVSELPEQQFTFTLLNSPVVNAFALPGGYVYVTRGILALAADEAELAGVIAHEIGHVTGRHTAQRHTQSTVAQGTGMLGVLMGGLFGGEAGARAAAQLAQAAAPAWVMSYSREQEFEADELGIRYLTRAGYDPRAMASFLGRLQGQAQLEAARTGRSADPEQTIYASHPRTLDRVARAAQAAAERADGPIRRNRDAYLLAVDGMRYGDDPAEGLVLGRSFVHPGLGFRFDAPPGFTLANSPTQVIGRSADGAVMVFDGAQRSTPDVASYLQREWPGQGATRAVWPGQIDGHAAATGLAVGRVGNQVRQVLVGAIDAADAKVWRFQFVAPQLDQRSVGTYQAAIESFRFLSPAEAARYPGQMIRVHEVRPGERLETLMGTSDADLLAEARLINGLPLDGGQPEPGQRVKLIVPATGGTPVAEAGPEAEGSVDQLGVEPVGPGA